MTWRDIYDVAMGIGLPGLVVWYVRDRKRTQAAAAVAMGSVRPEISKNEISAFDIHVAYVERAFATERDSLERQIGRLQSQVTELQLEGEKKDELIEELRMQVGVMKRQIEDMGTQLSRINNERGGA